MKQYVKTFESFFSEPDIEIIGSPSGQNIKVTLDELTILMAQGIVFKDKTYSVPEEINDSNIEGVYTFMDYDLEAIEEFLHRDVDNDNEAGEDPLHVAKVLGTNAVDEYPVIDEQLNYYTILFENMEVNNLKKELNKDYVEVAVPFGPVFKLDVSLEKHLKMTNDGYVLYCFDKDDDNLKLNPVKSRNSSIPTNVAYWMKPALVDGLNELGEHVSKIIQLKKQLFKSTVNQLAQTGGKDRTVIEPIFSLYNRFDITKK